MKPEDEIVFDEQFDKLLSSCSKEVREIMEPKRVELKTLTDKIQQDIKATDDMLRHHLGTLYPWYFPYANKREIPLYPIRPTKRMDG